MRLLIQFSRRFLYRHPGQLILALAGIAAGVAVVTGVALMRDVLVESLDSATDALSGRESLRIEAPGEALDERLMIDLATSAGAPNLVPVLRARVRLDGQLLELLGLDPMAIDTGGPMGLSGAATGALLATPNGFIASQRTFERLAIEAGDERVVRAAGRQHELQAVGAFAAGREMDDRLVMDLANAQQLLDRRGELSWVEAPPEAREWLAERLPDSLILTDAGQRRASAASLTEGMRTNLGAMSLLSLAVGLFVIHAVFSFLLVQRRRDLGMLRAVGVTQRQVGWLLGGETLVLAGLGALAGLVLGTWLATSLLELARQPVAELYRMVPAAGIAPSPGLYAGIWLLAVASALASVSTVLRRAMATPPGQLSRQEQAGTAPGNGQLAGVAGALGLAGLALIVFVDSLIAVLAGLFVLLAACALLAPLAGSTLLRAGSRRLGSGLARRALAMLGSARSRIGPALSALSLALALSAGMAMMVLGFRVAVDDWIDRLLRADVYMTAAADGLDQQVLAGVEGWPEVEAVSTTRERVLGDGTRLMAYDLPPEAWGGFELLAGDTTRAREAFQAGRGALVSEAQARNAGLSPGAAIALPTRDGERRLEVVGVYRDYTSDRGIIAIDGDLYRSLWNDAVFDSFGLYLAEGQSPEALSGRVEALPVEARLTDRAAVIEQTLAVFDRTFRISWALAILVAIIAGVALVSALLALGLERGREYATLRALGLTRTGLARLVLTQTTALAAAAAALAVPISLAIHAVLSLVVQPRAFGWSVGLTLPWQPWAVMIPLALLAGLLAGLYPAWAIARRDPAPMLRAS